MYHANTNEKFYNVKRTSIKSESTQNISETTSKHTSIYEDVKDKLRTNNREEKVLDTSNPNYGNYWSEEKKQQLREKLRKQGHSQGKNNPNYGKTGDKAKNGQKIVMCDLQGNPIKLFMTKIWFYITMN